MTAPTPTHVHTAIIGSGFSGLGAGIRLKQEGFHDYVILERAGDVGGVWRDNTYPGCACDVESHLYCFSFAPKPDWKYLFGRREEIQDYLQQCARDYGMIEKIRFNTSVTGARWNEDSQRWHIETSTGPVVAQFVIAGSGPLYEPNIPKLKGIEKFKGATFHSARWDHNHELKGRKVAVIGTGASAIQFVPEIQPEVSEMKVFQRTPGWVLPRMDRAVGRREQLMFRAFPATQRAMREAIYLRRELFLLAFRNPRLMAPVQKFAADYLERKIKDPVLRAKLTPDYTLGCKRILISRDYLPALAQPNVDVVTDGIREVTENAIITEDGTVHEVDTIIYGTGFHVTDPPYAKGVFDDAGRSAAEVFEKTGPRAHLGTTISGFPNLFLMLGPNSGSGHTSMIMVIESQLELVLQAFRHARDHKVGVIDPRPEAQAKWIEDVDKDAEGTVWTTGGCSSWYNDASGRNATLWPGSIAAQRKVLRFRTQEYRMVTERKSPVKAGAETESPPDTRAACPART